MLLDLAQQLSPGLNSTICQTVLRSDSSDLFPGPLHQHADREIFVVIAWACSLLFMVLVLYLLGIWAIGTYQPQHKHVFETAVDLCACSLALLITNCSHAILQEFIMTKDYNGEQFPSVPFLTLCNLAVIIVMAGIVVIVKQEQVMWLPVKWSSVPAASYLISMNAQYYSLAFVTFPTLVVFKSAKIVPTMAMNTLLNRVHGSCWDYVLAVIICCSVAGFSLLMEDVGKASEVASNTGVGILLMVLYLATDAFASNSEKKVFITFPDFSSRQMMLAVGGHGFLFGVCIMLATGGFNSVPTFMMRHPEAWLHVFSLAAFASCASFLVVHVVRHHGPVVYATISTVRQILSVVISAHLYGHVISWSAIACATVAFTACLAKPLYVLHSALNDQDDDTEVKGINPRNKRQSTPVMNGPAAAG